MTDTRVTDAAQVPTNQPAALTSLTPMLRYRIQEAHGQCRVGYFLTDPKDRTLKLVARTQHNTRVIADARASSSGRTVGRRNAGAALIYGVRVHQRH